MPVTFKFDADDSGLRNAVTGSSQSVSKLGDAVDTVKARIVASFQAQIQAAQRSGASAQQLANIQSRSAQQMASATETNANRMIAALDRLEQKQQRVAEAAKVLQFPTMPTVSLGGGSDALAETAVQIEHIGTAGEHAVTGVQASSAAIRALQGDIFANRRAAEVFASTLPGLSNLISAAFPVIGAVALAAAIVRMGKAAYEAYQNIVNLKGAIAGLNQEQISVDKRVQSLADQTESHVEDILSKNSGRSAGLQQKLNYQSNKGLDLSDYFYNDAVKKLPDDVKGNYESLYKSVAPADVPDRLSKITREVNALNGALEFNKKSLFGQAQTTVGDFGAKDSRNPVAYIQARLTMAKQIQAQLQAASTDRGAGLEAIGSDIAEAQKQEAEKRQRQAEEAARKAQQATRKAIEAQRTLWQEQNDAIKISGGQTAALEAYAWQTRIEALKKGSAGYAQQLRYAQHELATVTAEMQRQDAETAKRAAEHAVEKANKDQSTKFSLDRDSFAMSGRRTPQQMADLAEIQTLSALPVNIKEATDRWREAQAAADRYADEAQKAADKAAESAAKNKAQVELASLAIQEQTGQISRLDAAQQTANIQAQEYATTMEALRKTLAEANAADPNGAAAINAQAAVDKANADRQVQVMQDAANTAAATWQGALRNANAAWVQDSQDSAKQVVEFYRQALDGLNDNLSDLMTGKKANFAGYFQGLGKTLANDSLKQAEGSVLGMFGIKGKPDGSKSNPLNVSIVGGNGAAGNTGFSGLGSLLGGKSGDDDSDSGSGGIIGGLAKFAIGLFGGARAMGGGVDMGSTYLVGEAGPELFSPKSQGTIIPNHQLGGSNAYYTVNVANGVTPEQMHMHMQSVLKQYHPQVVRSSVQAMQDHQSRNPTTRR